MAIDQSSLSDLAKNVEVTGVDSFKPLISKVVLEKITDDLTQEDPDLVLEAFRKNTRRDELKALAKDRYKDILDTDEKLEYAMQEIVGMGFIERILIKEPETTDIRYNGTDVTVKTNREKYIYKDEEVTEQDVIRVLKRFANATGKDFTEKEPRMNAQFGYMRVNGIHRKNAPYGTTLAIRISKPRLVVTDETFGKMADDFILDLFKFCMKTGMNEILSGKPGSGKTELTKTMTGFLDFKQSIITIEDTPEGHFKLLFPHLDITSWYTNNNLTESDLIDEALRNDCDWLMVTETRTASAAYALFKGFLTGCNGITSIHAGSAREIPQRYYNMIKGDIPIDKEAFYSDFFGTVHIGCHQDRIWVGDRIVRYIDEIVEFTEDREIVPIYNRWEEDGIFYSEVPNKLSKSTINKMLAKGCDIKILEGTGLI